MSTSNLSPTPRVINPARVVAFAPPQLRAVLDAATQDGLDVAKLRELLPGYRDDFESKRYLEAIIASSSGPLPVLQPEVVDASRAGQGVAQAARDIEQATQMPTANAELFAEAGYSVEQSRRAFAAGMPAGQALVLHKMGVETEAAITLGSLGRPPHRVYDLLKKGLAPELVGQALRDKLDTYHLPGYRTLGFTDAEALTLIGLEVYPPDIPPGVGVAALEAAAERGLRIAMLRELVRGGHFSFEQACALTEQLGPYFNTTRVRELAAEQLSVDEIVQRMK
ncbi:MAG: hypothetical protein IPJ65_41790 [Archangiaceae bacterium]|nr:hypothetical protein [Archangiaceae bacterium]